MFTFTLCSFFIHICFLSYKVGVDISESLKVQSPINLKLISETFKTQKVLKVKKQKRSFQKNNKLLVKKKLKQKHISKKAVGKIQNKLLLLVDKKLNQYKYYPKQSQLKGEEGVVKVRFKISPNKNLNFVDIIKSSEYESLDQAAIEIAWKSILSIQGENIKLNKEYIIERPISYNIID